VAHESPSASRTRADAALILVIEDERPQQVVLTAALEARGYRVEIAGTGQRALELVASLVPDVVLLDLGLPDVDGIQICRHVRNLVLCPVIVVTADAMDQRMIEALDLGADDYIVKPFNVHVLLARIRVALRHRSALAPLVEQQVLECGDVRIDVAAHQVMVDGEEVELHARSFALLAILVRNRSNVMTHAALARALDGYGAEDSNYNALRILVSRLRKSLGTGPRRPQIMTEHGVGYRLVPRDETDDSDDSGDDR
jgi:two-component system, OmpR family, KDP operon response regulator KdpE